MLFYLKTADIMILVVIIMFIFAVIGMNLMGSIKLPTANCLLNDRVNFQTFGWAYLTVFRYVSFVVRVVACVFCSGLLVCVCLRFV